MPWNIEERQAGTVTVLELTGRLTMGEGSDPLDSRLQALIGGGQRAVLLDCRQVESIDSRGLKTLVRALTSMERAGGKLKLLQPAPRLRQVLEFTRLQTVIEVFEDESQAIASFSR